VTRKNKNQDLLWLEKQLESLRQKRRGLPAGVEEKTDYGPHTVKAGKGKPQRFIPKQGKQRYALLLTKRQYSWKRGGGKTGSP